MIIANLIKKNGRRLISIDGYEIDCTTLINNRVNIEDLKHILITAFEYGEKSARFKAIEAFKDLIQSKFLTEYEEKNNEI